MSNEPVPAELQKLRELADRIKKLMRDADVAGTINLQGKDYAEFCTVIDPSWSALKWERRGVDYGIRFKCKLKTGTPEEKEMGRLTVGLIEGMLHVLRIQCDNMEQLSKQIKSLMAVETKMEPIKQPDEN